MQPQQQTANSLASLPPSEPSLKMAERWWSSLTEQERAHVSYEWERWARPDQLEPPAPWSTWLVMAGRGYGKTRMGAEWVRKIKEHHGRIALVGETAADVRDVMIEGESGILAISPPWDRPTYNPSKRQLTWANGAIVKTYSSEDPDQLRGPQHECFIAGTLVATPSGSVPIENIEAGDLVLTRKGPRRVTATRGRRGLVGHVSFSNGSSFVATGTHPVYTSRGWTDAADLLVGDGVCAIDASSGAGKLGTVMATEPVPTTSEPTRQCGPNERSGFIEKFGVRTTATFQKAVISITSMAIWQTTASQILSACQEAITAASITLLSLYRHVIGAPCPPSICPVQIVALGCSEKSQSVMRYASVANQGGRSSVESVTECASNAVQRSFRATATIAASVASTWQPLAEADVYCLTVEGEHEYFANGILVHNCAWVDELAKFRYATDCWSNLQFGLRLGAWPRSLVTTTPRPLPIIRQLVADKSTFLTRGSTFANAANLAPQFLEAITARYGGTRLGRQELEAEILDDHPNALWRRQMLEDAFKRISTGDPQAIMAALGIRRVVIGVDPSGADDEMGDSQGIIAAGISPTHGIFVLEDATVRESPDGWARQVGNTFEKWKADRIVAERNYGGEMVRHTIRTHNPRLPVTLVTASRGKHVRAEPIAGLYEQKKVHHIGRWTELEDQMCDFTTTGYAGDGSPDRADALVWALTELALPKNIIGIAKGIRY